jgi:hypothetical protein
MTAALLGLGALGLVRLLWAAPPVCLLQRLLRVLLQHQRISE